MESMGIEEEWLSQILGESTRKAYRRQVGYFMEFMGVNSAEKLIKLRGKERNFETRIIQFFQWLQKDKRLTSNSARACCIPLQSLFSYAGAPIRIKNKLPRMHMRIENWKPTLEDLQKVYRFNGIEVKTWMSLSRDCPARMSDLLRISPKQVQEGEFLLLSKKESVVGKVYISDETKALFQHLEKIGKVLPRTQKGVDKMMESACKVAGLERRINQHLWRKLWITTAINLNINETVTKVLAFKSVPPELLTYYLDREDLNDSWKRVVEALPLEPKNNGNGRVNTLEQSLDLMMKALAKLLRKELEGDGSFKGVGFLMEEEPMETLRKYLESS